MRKKTIQSITLCASASCYKEMLAIATQLKKLGFTITMSPVAYEMQKTGDFTAAHYKPWLGDKNKYTEKTKLLQESFKRIEDADAVLLCNMKKDNQPNYFGGAMLTQMTIAFYLKKQIFIYNPLPKDLSFTEEVLCMNPRFINGDITKISL